MADRHFAAQAQHDNLVEEFLQDRHGATQLLQRLVAWHDFKCCSSAFCCFCRIQALWLILDGTSCWSGTSVRFAATMACVQSGE